MVTTAIVFDHRGRTAKGKQGPLEVRVTIDRKVYYVNTGIRVLATEWKFGMICNRSDSDELNTRLITIAKAVEGEINRCIEERRPVSVPDIRKRVWATEAWLDDVPTFLDWYEEQLPMLDVTPGTLKHYKTTLSRLHAWNVIRRWEDLTVENLYQFDAWLHGLRKPLSDAEKKAGMKPERLSDSGIFTYHKNMSGMLSRAVRFGLINSNPYDRVRFRKGVKESVEYLTEEEVAAFRSLRPVPGTAMAVAHDLFIFQLYTGLSYSDAIAFDFSKYKKVDGRWIFQGERVKTGVPYISQLLPPAVEVLERYGWQVPKILNGEYNQCLKALGMAAGITTKMHSHLARHTFATWMLRHGVKVENLARMLGHTKLEQTLRYAKVVAVSVHEDFDRIAELLNRE